MSLSPRSAADLSAKILLVRSDLERPQGHAFVLAGERMYVRSLDSEEEIARAVRCERFHLVLNDARSHPDNPFIFVEQFRAQHNAPLLLLCSSLEFEAVIRAIRLSVNDVLTPPFDFKVLQDQANHFIAQQVGAHAPVLTTALWYEIARFFMDDQAATPSAAAPARRDGDANKLRGERDRLFAELKIERESHVATDHACTTLKAELELLRNRVAEFEAQSTKAGKRSTREAELEELAASLARREESLAAEEEAHKVAAARLTQEHTRFEAERAAHLKAGRTAATQQADAQQHVATAKKAAAELAKREAEVAAAEEALTIGRKKLQDDRHAFEAAARQQGETFKSREAAVARAEADLAAGEAEVATLRAEAAKQQQSIAQLRRELEAAQEKQKSAAEAIARREQASKGIEAEIEQRRAKIAAQEAAIAADRERLTKEAEALRRQVNALKNERAAFEAERDEHEAQSALLASRSSMLDRGSRQSTAESRAALASAE